LGPKEFPRLNPSIDCDALPIGSRVCVRAASAGPADVGEEEDDDECGWFTYAKPECFDTILSIVIGIFTVIGMIVGAWQW